MNIKLISLFLLLGTSTLLGMFVKFSLEEIIERTPVILEGKVIDIIRPKMPKPEMEKVEGTEMYRLKHDGIYRYDRAVILVSAVIKEELKEIDIHVGDQIELFMPSARNKTSHSTDIRYDVTDEGIWLLSYKSKRLGAGHPMSLQQFDQRQLILDIVLNTKSNKSE